MNTIRKINNYLFIALGFAIPTSIALSNILMVFIVLLWLIEGDFKRKFQEIRVNKLAIALYLYLGYHVVSFLWSPAPAGGWAVVQLYYMLFLFPVFLTTIDSKYANTAILSFILAMTISEIGSYAIYFGLWKGLIPEEQFATAFLGHVAYTPMVAFTVFLLINQLVYSENSTLKKYLFIFFIVTMSFNIFISGGRAGQVAFVGLAFVSALLYFRKNVKVLLSILVSIPLVVVLIYFTNDTFQKRTNMTISTLQSGALDTALGERINFVRNSLEIIPKSPIFGVGAGGFPSEYIKINNKNTPHLRPTGQPHNQYIYILAQLGFVGLVILLYIFFTMYQFSRKSQTDGMSKVRYLFIAFYLIIMFSDIYLFAFATQLLFVYFSAMLYRQYEQNPFALHGKNS